MALLRPALLTAAARLDNLERLKLPVERILPLHGRIVPVTQLSATASRPMPAR
jgi:hypothetical protein